MTYSMLPTGRLWSSMCRPLMQATHTVTILFSTMMRIMLCIQLLVSDDCSIDQVSMAWYRGRCWLGQDFRAVIHCEVFLYTKIGY